MEPAISEGDWLLLDPTTVRWPRRGSIVAFHQPDTGDLAVKRADQQVQWMWATVRDRLMDRLRDDPAVRAEIPRLEAGVRAGELTATLAAETVLDRLDRRDEERPTPSS